MRNFEFQNSTRIIFGKDVEKNIGKEIKKFSSNILMVHYGDGIIEKLGIYDTVCQDLKKEGISYAELDGIRSNPHLNKVYEGIDICKEKGIDFILAIGGGSVMDTAKIIAAGIKYDGDVWDFFDSQIIVEQALPVGVIVTLPATGSETNTGAVVTNEKLNLKRFIDSNVLRPVFCMLNPEHTYSLPPYLTACGVADMLSHAFERYLSNDKNVDMSDRIGEGVIRSILYSGRKVMQKPNDYHARAEIMYAGLVANNGYISMGRVCGWEAHRIAHELTTFYGIAHGATLSMIFPAWMKYVYKKNLNRFMQIAVRIFDVDTSYDSLDEVVLEGFARMENFFKEIGLPTRLIECNVEKEKFSDMADNVVSMGDLDGITKLNKEDVINIYNMAFK